MGIPGGPGLAEKGIAGTITDSVVGGAWSAVTGAGQTIQTLNGAASLASTGISAAQFADGLGEAKAIGDFVVYTASLANCWF